MMKKRTDNCLAEGEVTGHAHRAAGTNVAVYGQDVERVLDAPDGATVSHEEHKQITLPPGRYDVSRQREIDPDTEDVRAVAD